MLATLLSPQNKALTGGESYAQRQQRGRFSVNFQLTGINIAKGLKL